jgi:hypothetical protein
MLYGRTSGMFDSRANRVGRLTLQRKSRCRDQTDAEQSAGQETEHAESPLLRAVTH